VAELNILSFIKIADRLLLSQYKKPNFESLFKIISEIFDDIQTVNFKLRDKFWLLSASGEQLEFIGLLWDEPRNSESDEVYRTRILDKIGQTSSGTIQEIKNFLYGAFKGTYAIYSSEYPAGYKIRTDAALTHEELNNISSSGVSGLVSGAIVTAVGDNLVDANGNYIIHVNDTIL